MRGNEIRDVAAANGYQQIHDAGKLVVFADAEGAESYLNGNGKSGVMVTVMFTALGDVRCATMDVDNKRMAVIRQDSGNAGERMMHVLDLLTGHFWEVCA